MTTTRYHLALSYHVTGDGTEVERLEEHLDRVAEQLLALDGIIDPDLGAELATGRVTFTLEVDAKTPEAALHIARSAVRTAIHATGHGSTAGWEKFTDAEQVVTPQELTSA